jgi:hypothetical protein
MDAQQKAEWVARMRDSAIEAVDRGWNVIPISINSKKPIVKWRDYQTRAVTVEEVDDWFDNGAPTEDGGRVFPFNLALITGSISGVLVLDCDNEDSLRHAAKAGWTSPFAVATTRGRHYYFNHPGHGKRYQNKVGGTGRDWPDVNGLDFRGDGGYVLMPPSRKFKDGEVVHEYEWSVGAGLDWDDLSDFPWRGSPTSSEDPPQETFSFDTLSLSNVRVHNPQDGASIYDQTKMRVALLGRKLIEGDGRNHWLVRFAGQKVRGGMTGDDLLAVSNAYMDEFFADRLPDQEVATVLRSALDMDRRNYPEDYDSTGERIVKEKAKKETLGRLRPVFSGDVQRLLDTLGETTYWADPLIPAGTITQVVGYNGHGKSYFLAALLTSMASGRGAFGPYATPKPGRVFYLDYDNPARTVLHRLSGFNRMFGDTGENFALWTPTLISPEDGGEMNLATEAGFKLLGEWVAHIKPDIVVIDTVRNAFGGMDENSPQEWFKVNHVAKTIRNTTGASVVLVHHRNKPGEGGLGREAGSTAQLTDIDTQVLVTQVFRDKNDAKSKAGLVDAELSLADSTGKDWSPFGYLEQRLEADSRLKMVSQVSFGKVRQMTEMHQTHYIGWAERLMDGSQYVVSTVSPRQKAQYLAGQGMSPEDISRKLSLPLYEVRRWVP